MNALFSGMDWFPICRDGGLDRYFYESISSLSVRGVRGTALVSWANEHSMLDVRVRSVAGAGDSIWKRWEGARNVAIESLHAGVDLVNVHFALYAFPWIQNIPRGVPLVVNFHGPWTEEMRVEAETWKKRLGAVAASWIERVVYRRADVAITLSESFRNLLCARYGVSPSRVRVVPGGVDLIRYLAAPERLEARRRLAWPEGRMILLTVRRLAKRMGLELLIDAVAEIQLEFPHVLLLIGGKGPEAHALQKRITAKQLDAHVRMLGFVSEEELPLAYAAADISMVPSTALEGFGLTTVESLASGTPVLGTPVGGTPEILRPLDPSLVFEAPTVPAMAQRLGQVLRREVPLPDRETCRRYALQYGWPEVAPMILAVYEEAVALRRETSTFYQGER